MGSPCTPPAHPSLAASDSPCLRGPSIFEDTNFVVYRSVSGLRANLGRWPIFSSFSCLSPVASGDLERKHPSFQGKVSRENDTISSDRIWKTQSWLRDSMRQEKKMALPLDFRLSMSVYASLWIFLWGSAVNYKLSHSLSHCMPSKSPCGNNGWGEEVRKLPPETSLKLP